MSTFENSAIPSTNISGQQVKKNVSSPTSSDHSLRNNNTSVPQSKIPQQQHEEFASTHQSPHVHQSYSTTTTASPLHEQTMSTNNIHAFKSMSPSYLSPLQQDVNGLVATSTITTNYSQHNSSTTDSSTSQQGELVPRSNHRNSPPTSAASTFIAARGQTFTQQENEAILFGHNTTKTSNTNQHVPSYPVPLHHHQHSIMNGNSVGNGTTTATNSTNNNMASNNQGHQQDQDKIVPYHHSNQINSSTTNNNSMNGSASSHQQGSMYGIPNSFDNMGSRSISQSNASIHDKNLLPSLHVLMDPPTSNSTSNQIPHSNSRVYAPPSNNSNGHMRPSSSNNLQQSNYMNHHQPPITPIPYSQHVNDYQPNHVPPPYINKASHHIDMFSNSPSNNNMVKTSSSSNMDANNMYAPRPIRSRSNTSGPNNASFNSPPPQPSSLHHHQNDSTVYSFEQPAKIKKKKALATNNEDSTEADKKNWKKKRLFSIDEVTDLVAFVKQRSENQELTRDVNYAIFKEYEKLQDERRRASVYRKKYVQLFERHLISKDGTIDPSLFQEYDQRTSSKSKGTHSEDVQEKRKFSDVEEDSSSEGSNEEEKKSKKLKREYSDEEDEEIENVTPSDDKKKNMNICVSYKGKNYLHLIEKQILQNSDSIHNYFNHLSVSSLCCNNDIELIRSESIEYFDYSFGEFIQINSFSIPRVLKSIPVKLRIN